MSQRDIDIKDLNLAESFLKQDDMVEINLLQPHTMPASPYCTTPASYPNHIVGAQPIISHYTGGSYVADGSTLQTSSAPKVAPIIPTSQTAPLEQQTPATLPITQSTPIYSNTAHQQILKEVSRQARAYDAMEAYSAVYSTSFGLCTRDRNRREHIVFPLHFRNCIYVEVEPNSLYQQKSFYRITFAENSAPLIITQKDFESPNKLALALASHYKTSINLCGPKGKIHTGIQSFFVREMQCEKLDFFWGWKLENESWKYSLTNGKTHGERNLLPKNYIPYSEQRGNLSRENPSASIQLTAALQAAEMMNAISDVALRSIIWNMIHISALYTLLCYRARIPFGFCFYSEDTMQLNIVGSLFTWFQDSPVLISNDKLRFYQQLAERKDQPLLILDAESQIPNSKLIEQAITTGIITYSSKTESTLQSLPIVLSNSLSHLSKSPKLICLNLHGDVFSSDASRIIHEKQEYFMDYLYHFNTFVQDNQELFYTELVHPSESLPCTHGEHPLSPDCITLLQTVHAVEKVIHLYHTSLYPHEGAKDTFDGLFSDQMNSILLDALMCLSCQDSDATVREIFSNTAKQMIQEGCFDIREFGGENTFAPCPTDKQGIIYIYKNDPCLTKKAYDAVCNRTGYPYRIVKNALLRTNSFKGNSTNYNTPQYRISGDNPLTKQGYTAVYWFSHNMIPLPTKRIQHEQPDWIRDSSECNISLQLGDSVDGSPMVWNGRENSHICISGLSGSGKSYFLKKMIAQLPAQKVRCIIFDTSGDFSSTSQDKNPPEWPVEALEVVDMENTQAQMMFFKLLSPGDNIDKIIYRFVDILNRKNHFGRNQRASLIECLEFGFEQNQLSNFNDLLEIAKQISPYSAVENAIMSLNTILPYGKNDFDWSLDEPGITVLDFHSGHDDDSLKTVIELLLSTICATRMYMSQDDYPPVVLIFDECQLYDWNKGAYLYDIMARGRKYGLSAWLSTQALTLINNPEIPEQANLRVCFKPTDNEIPQIVKKFYLSTTKEKEDCKIKLANLVRGQFVCKLNGTIHISQSPQKK